MKRKGFTLIELLAVIVVLAIIALIAVPVIINIIKNADKNAFKDSAYGIVKAGNLYYSRKEMNGEALEEEMFSFPNNIEGLDISNSHLINGKMRLTLDGDISFALTNGKYCAKKELYKDEVIIDENLEDCNLVNPNISSDNICITKKSKPCENGVKVNVKVNDLENYDFYVISDTGSELTLITDRNLGSNLNWISKKDYIEAGGISEDYGSYGNNEKGPLTALKILEERTSSWTNIEAKNYTLVDDGGENKYTKIERTNARARMLNITEAKKIGCKPNFANSCPSFLYENLSSLYAEQAYWISSAFPSYPNDAWRVFWDGRLNGHYVSGGFGIRPVIEISKTL